MEIKWSYPLKEDGQGSDCYFGYFSKTESGISFLYEEQKDYENLRQLDLTFDGKWIKTTDYPVFNSEDIDLEEPTLEQLQGDFALSDCCLFEKGQKEYLSIGSKQYVSLDDHEVVFNPVGLDENNRVTFRYRDLPCTLGNYIIAEKGNCGIQCKSRETGKKIWDKKLIGYLYSEIIPYKQGILLGTAEKGGKLYYISLETGESYFEIDTHGTSEFVINEGYCYCQLVGGKAGLLKINLSDGTFEKLDLSGKGSIDAPLRLIDKTIYTLTFSHLNDGKNANPTIYAIDI